MRRLTKKGEALNYLEKFFKRKHPIKNCCIWPFARSGDGRAMINSPSGIKSISRIVCCKFHGNPSKLKPLACHSCDNGNLGCINPNHLYWGSYVDNANDAIKNGKMPRGEKHGIAKLTKDQIPIIRKLLAKNIKYQTIAEKFGVTQGAIYSIKTGRSWNWV